MTRPPRPGKVGGAAGGWYLVAAAWLGVAGAAGCHKGDERAAAEAAASKAQQVKDRQGVLTVTLPVDLLVHRHDAAIQATTADGGLRLYLAHQPDEKLIRLVGNAKDVLRKRGWDTKRERHYEQAVELNLERGGVSGVVFEVRTLWWVRVGGRVLLCDGVAGEDHRARLEEILLPLCQQVVLEPLPPAPADAGPTAPDGGAAAAAGPPEPDVGPAPPRPPSASGP
jgi:hypothetical protein